MTTYSFAGSTLDVDTRELRRDGAPVHVEPQVLSVLEYLVTHRDRVVTKIELLDEVWGSRFVSESALTSRIKSARQACGDNGRDQRVIRTIHGHGYRFVAEVDTEGGAPKGASVLAGRSRGIIGRHDELAALDGAADEVLGGNRRTIVVSGAPGIGKSTLLADAVERVDDHAGWMVLRGQCLESRSGTEPYFALLDAFARSARQDDGTTRDVLERVAPTWLAQLPSLLDDDDVARLAHRLMGATPVRMLREGVEVFEELARHAPTLLVVEDLQWADPCTLDVLDLLVRRDDEARLLVVASLRPGASAGRDLVNRLATSGRVAELELAGLDDEDCTALVTDVLGCRSVAPEIVEIARERTDGVPLLMNEIVSWWRRSGHLDEGDHVGPAVSTEALAAAVPDSLRQLVEADLARADHDLVEALEVAAVAGRDVVAASLAPALSMALDEVERVLTRAGDDVGYLTPITGITWPDGTTSTRFRFRHELYREILDERMLHHRRATIHGEIGRAIEAGHAGRTHLVATELAHHFVAAADHPRAAEYLRVAGELAVARNAFEPASDLLTGSLAHLEHLEDGPDRRRLELATRMVLGPTLVATRGWFGSEVAENYERAIALCRQQGPCDEGSIARYGLATVTELRGQYARTEALLEPMLSDPTHDLMNETHELLACSAFHQGNFETSLEHASAVLARWDDLEPSPWMARLAEHPASACSSWASLAAWFLGETDRSLEFADQAIAAGHDHLYALSTARVQRAFLHQFRGEVGECADWARATIELADEQGFPMRSFQAHILLGWAEASSGDPSGVEHAARALESFRASGALLSVPYLLGLVAEAHLVGGEYELAGALLDEAVKLADDDARSFFYGSELHRLRGAVMAADPSQTEGAAADAIRTAVVIARRLNSPPLEMRALTSLVELAGPDHLTSADRERLRALVDAAEGQAATVDVHAAREVLTT